MALSKFKYTGGTDTGVNPEKSKTLYGILFPVGKAVEVPDDVAHKMRTRTGHKGAEFEEVTVGPEKTDAELQREKENKAAAAQDAKPEKLSEEDLKTLKEKASKEDARVAQVQNDARLGR